MSEEIKKIAINRVHSVPYAIGVILTILGGFIGATIHDTDFATKAGVAIFTIAVIIEIVGLTLFFLLAIMIVLIYIKALKEASK